MAVQITCGTFPAAAAIIAEQFPAVLARVIGIYAIVQQAPPQAGIGDERDMLDAIVRAGVNHFTAAEITNFGITPAVVRANSNWALRWACHQGSLANVQWLVTAFGLTAADARSGGNLALAAACAQGHLQVAQWLVSAFGLTAADVGANSNHALACARHFHHYHIVRWLEEAFGVR